MSFDRAYTFIYYKDMGVARGFYGYLLGLEEEAESSWTPYTMSAQVTPLESYRTGKGTSEHRRTNP
jgi:hypothetical protein